MGKSVRHQGETRARPQGPELRVRRGGPRQEERASAQLQPGAQEDPGAHPQRRAGLRVQPHRGVHRRGVRRPVHPPCGPVRASRCSLLGLLRRRQASGVVGHDVVQGQDGGGETRGEEGDVGGVGDPGGGSGEVLRREGLLRRGQRGARGHGAGEPALVAEGDGGDLRGGDPPQWQDPAPRRVDGAFQRARRCEGGLAGRGQGCRVRQDEAGAAGCRRSCGIKQLIKSARLG